VWVRDNARKIMFFSERKRKKMMGGGKRGTRGDDRSTLTYGKEKNSGLEKESLGGKRSRQGRKHIKNISIKDILTCIYNKWVHPLNQEKCESPAICSHKI